MNTWEIMESRHSVRQYLNQPVAQETRSLLDHYIEEINTQGNLHLQVFYDEPECFNSRLAHYGHFENVTNYIAVVGEKAKDLDERCGYYGEKAVLKLQELGLNSCWVALTHGRSKTILKPSEKEVIIIAFGYGRNQGFAHRNKDLSSLCNLSDSSPEWFRKGMEAVLLAPTATNQQKYRFTLLDNQKVKAETSGIGPYLKLDLGIVKYHFELGSEKDASIFV